ncbi:MAG: hypothetical protein LBH81_03495 [Rickettsiales bacterium]|jgi:hypothetical protein|nr:hypothetical protein [Rickettsiales bacterium]
MRINFLFSSENFTGSVLAHLVIAAFMLTSFVLSEPMKIVAPEQMKIMDIDLSQVKISKDKTRANARDTVRAESPKGQGDKSKPAAPAPIVKTVAVQRDSAPIARVVNVSVVDALRIAMTRCWHIDTTIPGLEDFNLSAHLTMGRGGFVRELWIENESLFNDFGTGAYVLDTVRAAVAECQPFSMLPDEDFDSWKSIKLNFFPQRGSVN